jgi:hypothetical protein
MHKGAFSVVIRFVSRKQVQLASAVLYCATCELQPEPVLSRGRHLIKMAHWVTRPAQSKACSWTRHAEDS